ncbi:Peptidase M48, Ste24p [Beggiatoa sp. PS]|nr:Peptidase M48, Ste24p [Beggiatoa sp. PS]
MSPADEQKLGETFLRQIRREVNVIDDIQISNYFNALGHRLASYSNAPAQNFYFFTIEKSSLNAFAIPGGFIGIHSGLILKTRSESELASVLAHEISHVTQRHIARTIEASERFSLPTIAAIIAAAILAGASNSPQVGEAAMAAVMAGNVQMQINFTRTHEKEADRLGMQILAKSGFEPRDMANVFERFYTASRFYESAPEFLRTHPVTTDRIAEARERAQKYDRQPLSDTPLYHLMKAKLLVLITDDKQKLLKKLKKMVKTGRYRDERATRYALALTLLDTKQTHGVQTQIDWLLKNDSDRVVYRLLQSQLALLQKNDPKAMQIYEQALQIYPGDKMLGLDYAEKLLQNNAPKKSKTVLLGLKAFNNPYYHRLLARAYQEIGEKAQAHLALAENYYLIGYTRLAIEQLESARQINNIDFYLASRIDARLEEMQEELFELHKASNERGERD